MIRIFNVAVSARVLTLFLAETCLLYGSFLVAARFDPDVQDLFVFLRYEAGFWRISLVVCQILLGLYFRDLYSNVRIRNRLVLVQELCMIFGIAFLAQGLTDYIAHDITIPRKVIIGGSCLSIVCIWGARLFFNAAARGAGAGSRVLFLGMSPTVVEIADYLRRHPELGLAPVGYLDTRGVGETPGAGAEGLPRLGAAADLDRVVEECNPASIVIANRADIQPWWTEEFLELRFGGVTAEEAGALYERTLGRVCAAEIWPFRMIFSDAYEPPALDIGLQTLYSMGVALLAAPFALVAGLPIAAAIRATSRGPALLRERRIGAGGKPFTMYRFRCAKDGMPGEPTGLGRLLRRTGLDWLPALFNVLSGRMALVGPRPEPPEFHARLSQAIPFYGQRNRVRPGLTGWEQVHSAHGGRDAGGTDPDAIRSLEYDLYYVKHLSLALDSAVLMLTMKKAFAGDTPDA